MAVSPQVEAEKIAGQPGFPPALQHPESVRLHLTFAGQDQAFLVVQGCWGPDAAQVARAAYDQIAQVLQNQGLTIVHERLFGSLSVKPGVMASRAEVLNARGIDSYGPLTYIQGQPPWGQGLAGIIIQTVTGNAVWTIRDQGKAVGRGWQQDGARFLLLQNLQGLASNGKAPKDRSRQIRDLIHRAAGVLEAQGASYRDVVRTWFYIDDILAWYPEFNQARSAVYRELGLMPVNGGGSQRLPASTGIRGEVSTDTAGALDLLAVVGPAESPPQVRQMRSPAQPEALTYGSAFSRGMIIGHPEVSLIQVSGTAAIDEQGASLYPGDIRGQIDCTFDKITALLGQDGATLKDVAAACVFLKSPQDASIYQEQVAALGLKDFPAVVMVADICRQDLLFEIDAEVAFEPVNRQKVPHY